MPKKDTKQKGKNQAIAPVGLKVKLVDAHARAKDGDRGGRKQPAGANQAHQPGQRVKALKKKRQARATRGRGREGAPFSLTRST